jgi:GNAT superfamily N-acetyltransferase
MLMAVLPAEIEMRDRADLAQLLDLYAGQWWTAGRTAEDVTRMLAGCAVVIALVDRETDRLVGFARALSDGVYTGLVLDVIVAEEWRGRGLGAALMEALLEHPLLSDVTTLELTCQPRLFEFYRRFGFTEQVGGSRLMRRTSDPRLLGPLTPPS